VAASGGLFKDRRRKMSDDRDAAASSVILSFLLGGVAGAALALLYAPRSGRETREYLGGKLREGAERGRELRDQAVEKGRSFLDDASGFVDRQRDAMDDRKERFTAAVEAGRQAYREERNKVKS
jgi:gas vesicle protein